MTQFFSMPKIEPMAADHLTGKRLRQNTLMLQGQNSNMMIKMKKGHIKYEEEIYKGVQYKLRMVYVLSMKSNILG